MKTQTKKRLIIVCIVIGFVSISLSIYKYYQLPKPKEIGHTYEEQIINVAFYLYTDQLEINDTLFFIVKHDSIISCETKHEKLYLRRYKY